MAHRRAEAAAAASTRLRCAGFERGAERLAHRVELDPVEHVGEEAAHDQALGLAAERPRAIR